VYALHIISNKHILCDHKFITLNELPRSKLRGIKNPFMGLNATCYAPALVPLINKICFVIFLKKGNLFCKIEF